MGGGQEFGLRSGTLPLPLIVGFTKAIEIAVLNQKKNIQKFLFLRDKLLKGLLGNNSGVEINGSMKERLPHNLNLTVLDVNGSKLHKSLKSKIICSSGSACSNGEPSHVLLALGRSFKEAEASLRLSIGLMTTKDDIEKSIEIITDSIKLLRRDLNYFNLAILNFALRDLLLISISFSFGVIGFFVRFFNLSSPLKEFFTSRSSIE